MSKIKLTDKRNYFKPFSYPWAYDAFLESEQSHWLHTEVSMIDDVKDWNNKLNDNERYFLTQIFRFFTQGDCFSSDTEILTSKGWKNFSEITYSDKVAQYTIDGNIEFVFPLNIINKQYNGGMIRFSADKVDVNHLITPGHNVVYSYKNILKKETAKNIKLYQRKQLKTAGKIIGDHKILTPLERIWIAFQADGNLHKDVNGSNLGYIPHRFTFSKERKINRFRQLLDESNLKYNEYIEDRLTGPMTTFYVKSDIKMCKEFSWIDLENLNYTWCQDFCEEVVFWDGHTDKHKNRYYYNTNIDAANKVYSVACLGGYGASIKIKKDDREERYKDIYKVTIGKLGYQDCQHVNKTEEQYDGMVHCVTVPSGMILVRSNGYSLISGNCDVSEGYVTKYLPYFPQPEVRMMLLSFANRESIHIAGYSHLIESLGMPETTYQEFDQYKEMADKHDFFENIASSDENSLAQQIAAFSAFTEGVQLFSSFVMLLNFQRNGMMKGMGQIIVWSIVDESHHCDNMIKLFRAFIEENRHIWKDKLKSEIYSMATKIVELEDNFIDLAFKMGPMKNLTADEVKQYIRYICDRRLISLGLKGIFKIKKNPLPWVEYMINVKTHGNFFESNNTDYSKGALEGSWGDVWK
jgi:ribonucleoside-diphosphate reductase beta chain